LSKSKIHLRKFTDKEIEALLIQDKYDLNENQLFDNLNNEELRDLKEKYLEYRKNKTSFTEIEANRLLDLLIISYDSIPKILDNLEDSVREEQD
jgi:hypothetical protein